MEQDMKELVGAARQGDQQAITQLYEMTYRKAYYLAMQLLKNEDQVQDVLQDSYIKAFQNLEALDYAEKFQGWLDTIVINKSKDYLKKRKPVLFSQMVSEDSEEVNIDFEDESGQFSPEKTADYNETKRLIQEMIDELPDSQRMAIILRYLEDIPVRQIAEIMECSEGTVKSRLNYGRKAIKEKVLELERKGTKLYCLPLAPFLYWMFRQQFPTAGISAAAAAGTAGAAGTSSAMDAGTASGTSTTAGAGTGAAAGSAGTGAAGTAVAGAVGKTGLVVLGKVISVKAAAITAAVLCLGAGAAAGAMTIHSHSKQAAVQVEVEETQEDRMAGNVFHESEGEEENFYSLTKEEIQSLKEVYQAGETGDYADMAETLYNNFARLYEISEKKFQGEYVLFDGERLNPSVDGKGILLKIRSHVLKGGGRDGETGYHVIVYQGNFINGVPDGKLTSFYMQYFSWDEDVLRRVHISSCNYENGILSGKVRVQLWMRDEKSQTWTCCTESYGDYRRRDGGGLGKFDIKIWDYDMDIVCRDDIAVAEEDFPDQLEFHVNILEEKYDNNYEGEYILENNEIDVYSPGVYITDITGRYMINTSEVGAIIHKEILWVKTPSTHDEGAQVELPDSLKTGITHRQEQQ